MKIFMVGFGILLTYLISTYNSKPDYSRFDMIRCYAKPSFTYWGDGSGSGLSKANYRSVIICWPKHGVFMLDNAAMAWDSRGIKK